MNKSLSYLSKLRFDTKLSNSRVARYINNPRLVTLLVLMIVITGVSSFLQLPKVLNPSVKIPIVIISTPLPGASPNDVESLVTIPIEQGIAGLSGLDTYTSTSQNSVSVVELQFVDGTDPDKALQDTQTAVNQVNNLPKDVKTPTVQKLDFENVPVWSFTITSPSDTASLMRFGNTLEQDLKNVSTVDHVTTSGLEEQEISIVIKPEAIATYGINPQTLSQAIITATASYPAGSVKTDSSTFALSVDPQVASIEDLRNLRISINGTSTLLSDVATVEERSKPDQAVAFDATKSQAPTRSIRFDVYKRSSTTIEQAIADAKKTVTSDIAQNHNAFEVHSLLDTSNEIDTQFNELIKDLSITVSLVFLVLFIFLGLRQAIVASLAIPLTFLITFSVMKLYGIDLSFIAFFSLLLSLGLLVDDTVVVISAMTAYFRSGKFTPLQTALLVWRDFITAVFTTTITTVWAFVPLLLASGIIGDFIKPVPIVVSSTLLASFVVAMLITLPLVTILLQGTFPKRVVRLFRIVLFLIVAELGYLLLPKTKLFIFEFIVFLLLLFVITRVYSLIFTILMDKFFGKRKKVVINKGKEYIDSGVIHFEVFELRYRKLLDKILSSASNRKKTLIMVICFALFAFLLLPLGFVQNEFFPDSDQNTLYVNLELPSGTNEAITQKETITLLNQLRKNIPQASFINASLELSISSAGFGFSGSDQNTSLLTIVLPDKSKRNLSSIDIAQNIRNTYSSYAKGNLTVTEESGGPPAGADVQIKLFGNDLSVLDTYSNKIEDYLRTQPGIVNIDKSVKSGTSKIVFVPNQQSLSDNGITLDQIGYWLRLYASGLSPESVQFNSQTNQNEDITIRTDSSDQFANTISAISVPTQNGSVPLTDLGTLQLEPNPTVITREEGKRTISVTASVTKGYSAIKANADMLHYVSNSLNLPSGYTWSTGGVNQQNQESITSILEAMVLSFLLIIVTMVLQFSSFRRAFIVMLVIPLSTAGVFVIFAITHTPLSFPALIGVLALFGIVVKNSILIVDKIVKNQEAGIPFKYAIIDASESRLEPIALTSFTAIIGLIPITLSNALWQGLGGAIIAGLTFSGTIMLFFIPVVYYMMFQPKNSSK